uniref:Uncharacterized protein n=1 Tax=Mycetohabitans sp. TaxID=2571162 RepID=A0A6B9HDX1_9BURK|nr:hypothetical protein [Mycetohabitans sp.]
MRTYQRLDAAAGIARQPSTATIQRVIGHVRAWVVLPAAPVGTAQGGGALNRAGGQHSNEIALADR